MKTQPAAYMSTPSHDDGKAASAALLKGQKVFQAFLSATRWRTVTPIEASHPFFRAFQVHRTSIRAQDVTRLLFLLLASPFILLTVVDGYLSAGSAASFSSTDVIFTLR